MNEQTINRLRKKFIAVALLSFLLVMIFMGGLVYLVNMQSTARESRIVLDRIVEYDGKLPTQGVKGDSSTSFTTSEESGTQSSVKSSSEAKPDEFSDENVIQYFQHVFYFGDYSDDAGSRLTTRYFAVLYNSDDQVEQVIQNYIESLTADDEIKFAEDVRDRGSFGMYGDYYYRVAERKNGGTIVVFGTL